MSSFVASAFEGLDLEQWKPEEANARSRNSKLAAVVRFAECCLIDRSRQGNGTQCGGALFRSCHRPINERESSFRRCLSQLRKVKTELLVRSVWGEKWEKNVRSASKWQCRAMDCRWLAEGENRIFPPTTTPWNQSLFLPSIDSSFKNLRFTIMVIDCVLLIRIREFWLLDLRRWFIKATVQLVRRPLLLHQTLVNHDSREPSADWIYTFAPRPGIWISNVSCCAWIMALRKEVSRVGGKKSLDLCFVHNSDIKGLIGWY